MLLKQSTARLLIGLHLLFALEAGVLFLAFKSFFRPPSTALAPVLQEVIPAVVTLRVTGERRVPKELKPPSDAPAQAGASNIEMETFRTGGSGVIIDSSARFVVTNNHIIENATDIDVGLADGRHYPAAVIGRDAGSDLAVLQMDGSSLPSIRIGNSDSVRVGDIAIAVGNPFGLEGTATIGIISALMRTDIGHETFEDYLQTDAQINPGNSGGALINARGELIGINTVVGGARAGTFSIGFAIPINMARAIADQLIKKGRVRRGSTGLGVETLRYDPSAGIADIRYGAVVTRVAEGSPAEHLGIKRSDVVVEVAGKPVRRAREFMTRVSMVPLDGKVAMVINSQGRRRSLVLSVASLPPESTMRHLPPRLGSINGLGVTDILPGNPLYGDVRGVQIVEVPPLSHSKTIGLEAGDVIVRVETASVLSTDELIDRIERAGPQYRLEITRSGTPLWLNMRK